MAHAWNRETPWTEKHHFQDPKTGVFEMMEGLKARKILQRMMNVVPI
jgi:hypothetical protein